MFVVKQSISPPPADLFSKGNQTMNAIPDVIDHYEVNELLVGIPGDPDVGDHGIASSWVLPEPFVGTQQEINAFCDEVQALFAKHLGEDVRVSCDALEAIAAQAEQAYADDLAIVEELIKEEWGRYTEEIDLENYREDDFYFDAHRERALFRH